jgi:hypothetical protein
VASDVTGTQDGAATVHKIAADRHVAVNDHAVRAQVITRPVAHDQIPVDVLISLVQADACPPPTCR